MLFRSQSNNAFAIASVSANIANLAYTIANNLSLTANLALLESFAAISQSGAASVLAQGSSDNANIAYLYANGAFSLANTLNIELTANAAYLNSAFSQANVAGTVANTAIAIAFNSLQLQGGEITGNVTVDGTLKSIGNLAISGNVLANSLTIDAGTF